MKDKLALAETKSEKIDLVNVIKQSDYFSSYYAIIFLIMKTIHYKN